MAFHGDSWIFFPLMDDPTQLVAANGREWWRMAARSVIDVEEITSLLYELSLLQYISPYNRCLHHATLLL